MDLVPSFVHQNWRGRILWNRIHFRPLHETFHEFLANVVLWTMGEEWWRHQIAMPEADRHIVVHWKFALEEFKRANLGRADREQVGAHVEYSLEQSGPVASLLQLGYDFYCLQARNRLPDFLIEKMRRNRDFQSARYEVAAAAVMMRAGFDIEHLDQQATNQRHCELIATHRAFAVRVGVEAKSRVRPGVLNERGEFNYDEDYRGLRNLIRSAKRQHPDAIPFFIFMDVNLPPTPNVAWPNKPWLRDLRRALDGDGDASAENPDGYTALFPTNFAQYYGGNDAPASAPEWGVILPNFPKVPLGRRDEIVRAIADDSLARYGQIPRDI